MESPETENTDGNAVQQVKTNSDLRRGEWVKLSSNIVIPIIIGIFTIFIAVHQQNLAQANRDKDIAELIRRRTEDLAQEQKRREEDKELARQQRDDAKKAATAQLIEDRETARLQRELDWKIAEEKLKQEYELAEQQRTLSLNQREHEFDIDYQNYLTNQLLVEDRRKEKILNNYLRQLAKLLLEYDLTLNVSRTIFHSVLRMRTRMALKTVNPDRRTIIIRILHHGGLFTSEWEKEKLLLSHVNISGTQFGQLSGSNFTTYLTTYPCLIVEHADAQNATFRSIYLNSTSSFAYTNLDNTDWSFTELHNIVFNESLQMSNTIFSYTKLKSVKFQSIPMDYVSFQKNVRCEQCVFNDTSMLFARLDQTQFFYSRFESTNMADANLTHSKFHSTIFKNVIFDRANFSYSTFFNCQFHDVSMLNSSAINTDCTDLTDVNVNEGYCLVFKYK